MSFHLSAYSVLVGTTANTDAPALTDDILAISNSHFLPQRDYDIWWAFASSATADRARIVSPTNRQITLPFIRPISAATLPPNDPNLQNFLANPFRVSALEELAVEATSNIAMGTERFYALLAFGTGFEPVPRGQQFKMRGTSTTAAVASAWTTLTVTWADILPAGTYICLGLEVQATNSVAARIIFENQVERPGSIGIGATGSRQHKIFEEQKCGVWGRFRTTRMPIVQVLNNATDASHTLYLDLMRVA